MPISRDIFFHVRSRGHELNGTRAIVSSHLYVLHSISIHLLSSKPTSRDIFFHVQAYRSRGHELNGTRAIVSSHLYVLHSISIHLLTSF